jgi:Ca-activated chloride channel family protein
MLKRPWLCVLFVLALSGLAGVGASPQDDTPALWPDAHREFFQEGGGLLLDEETMKRFLVLDLDECDAFIEEFLGGDRSMVSRQDLEEGIHRRRRLVQMQFLSPLDVRARLLFLHGPPLNVEIIECGATYMPLQVWTYPTGVETVRELLLYRPEPGRPFRLWMPIDSKRVLYTKQAEYYMDQYRAVGGQGFRDRPDRILCGNTRRVEDVTGIRGISEYMKDRVTNQELRVFLEPPADLASWVEAAVATQLPEQPEVPIESLSIYFPERVGQRILTRFYIALPAGVELPTVEVEEGKEPEARLDVSIVLEQGGRIFDEFQARFKLPPPEGAPVVLAMDRPLRPNRNFIMRLRIEDEVGGGMAYMARGFRVPGDLDRAEIPPPPEEAIVALTEGLSEMTIAGRDSLILVPPSSDVVVAVWRAEALVTGTDIGKVVFSVDGRPQLTRRRPPWSVEVKLTDYPTEQIVLAEGFNSAGELVASDEVVLNQPTGALRVRILSPSGGSKIEGPVEIRAEVVVPENRRVEQVEFRVNDQLQATANRPPWTSEVTIPASTGELTYVAVVATLDNGSRAEDVRFLNSPQFVEEVDVKLVELFTTVTDRSGRLVKTLRREDFTVLEDGRPQTISKFELVEDLPLTVGIAIDSSGSMDTELPQAQQAAMEFLDNVITLRDRVFALSFSGQPVLLVPPTDDLSAVRSSLASLRSTGMTTLHDAVVTSLYYFRGVRGRRALIILSDGEDTASHVPYANALEYAQRAGVVIYTIGLNIGALQTGIRGKLKEMSEQTGGRSFFIHGAEEMRGIYKQIEEELRSQYLLTFSSNKRNAKEGEYRKIEIKLKGGFKARTLKGYFP